MDCFSYTVNVYIYIIYGLSPCVTLLQAPSCSSTTMSVIVIIVVDQLGLEWKMY